jgi:hypothetical protein
MEQLASRWTAFIAIWYLSVFEKVSRKFRFHYNLTRITGNVPEEQYF